MGEDVGDRWKKAAAKEAIVSRGRLTARARARNMPGFRQVCSWEILPHRPASGPSMSWNPRGIGYRGKAPCHPRLFIDERQSSVK